MHRVGRVFLCLYLCFLSSAVLADQVVLTNGDRLTGTIVKSDNKTLLIKTEFAGDVTVQWSAIQEIRAAAPLHVVLNTGKTIVGPVETSGNNLVVNTASGAPLNVPKTEVTNLRNDAEQAAYEKQQHPGLWQGWSGAANVGFALTRGNSQTKNLNLAFTAQRQTLRDKLSLYANTVFATNDAPGAVPGTTANATQGGIRYDRDITARLFGFGSADFQNDALQGLDIRSVLGGGLGLHAIKTDRTTLDLLGGGNYTRENYTTFTRNFAALTLGEDFLQKLGSTTSLNEHFYFYPDLSDTGEYRATFNFGTVTKLSKWLGWQNSFADIYVTNPPAGKKQNDILLSTGVNLSFTH
jgi:putative salt-induced outer membrane protein YdiY